MDAHDTAPFEFHISRAVRDRYGFDQGLFALNGNVIIANFHAARMFAQKINQRRDLVTYPEQAVKAGQFSAMGLIDEILHYVAGQYRERHDPALLGRALDHLDQQLGPEAIDRLLRRFVDQFPPLAVYRRELEADQYLTGETNGISNRHIALEELVLLRLANINPAYAPFYELFDDTELSKDSAYPRLLAVLRGFFEREPPFGPDQESLLDMLRAPAIAVPHSLEGQLEYMLQRWGYLLGQYVYRVLGSLDVIKEERKLISLGPGPSRPYEFHEQEQEQERFSRDREWMPRLVLMAKNSYVWLDQLSKKHQRPINRLDQIPDEELAQLAAWGFSGLWLIGLWERSIASQTIKQLTGNPDAVPSAYSLHDYVIAADLGGEEAYRNLNDRALSHGIRLASDMVPNHVGITSRWMVEHPEWFVSLDQNPYPWYTYDGAELSPDERVSIAIEDHYYSRSDAAVVFKRTDRHTGDVRYVYHGNDGTSMPWNDTAQLDYLNPEVREAVIQTILHVARQFPVIRFDAAMTLTKKHYQRLWYPEPGSGGAIPTRAEHGLTREQFNARMPNEFWREVVDRVAAEAPDTLLLAEAFWMLEGYFVRTLGMHRVYNSAYMNMLRDEDNAGYRTLIKNTLEFDPEILKRFVNFMNNPDERTAVDQFGAGDKYFGVCAVMATLPGLPMFGHGQVEGFTERYGMEYRRAYYDEQPERQLVERHQREIFPLLRRRHIFAEAEQFTLYDFVEPGGAVREDVYAYSNRAGDERSLVLYHNRYASVRGWIKGSTAVSVRTEGGGRTLTRRELIDGLALEADDGLFCVFRDHITGLEYIRDSRELCDQGLYVELGAYKYHVFLDFRGVRDNEWGQYRALTDLLGGRGVPSIDDALREVLFQPVHRPFDQLVNAAMFTRLFDARVLTAKAVPSAALLDEVEQSIGTLFEEVKRFAGGNGDPAALARRARAELTSLLCLPALSAGLTAAQERAHGDIVGRAAGVLGDDAGRWGAAFAWVIVRPLGAVIDPEAAGALSRSLVDQWWLGRSIGAALGGVGLNGEQAARAVAAVKLLVSHGGCLAGEDTAGAAALLEALLQDSDVRDFLRVNRHREVLWYHKDSFEELVAWLLLTALVDAGATGETDSEAAPVALTRCAAVVAALDRAGSRSGYQVDRLLAEAREEPGAGSGERGAGSGERGTGSGERGTGSGERGAGDGTGTPR